MTIPREAVEAAVNEWIKARPNLHATEPEIRALYERDMTRALTAALPHLAPKPTGSDELRMQQAFCCSDGCAFPDSCRASYTIVPKGYMRALAAVRAEERAAQATQIAALREALLSVQKAMRPFEWASQYVDHRLVGEPMVKQFTAAVGKLTIGNFNELARATTRVSAALEMSGGVDEPTGNKSE